MQMCNLCNSCNFWEKWCFFSSDWLLILLRRNDLKELVSVWCSNFAAGMWKYPSKGTKWREKDKFIILNLHKSIIFRKFARFLKQHTIYEIKDNTTLLSENVQLGSICPIAEWTNEWNCPISEWTIAGNTEIGYFYAAWVRSWWHNTSRHLFRWRCCRRLLMITWRWTPPGQ